MTARKMTVKTISIVAVSAEPGQEVAQGLKFAHARNQIADPARDEIGHRQRHQVLIEARAEFDIDPVGGMGEEIVSAGS